MSPSDLSMLRFMTKPNPRNAAWKPVRLYLVKHCRTLAWSKWGDAAGLEAEKNERAARREERRAAVQGVKRTRIDALATGGGFGEVLEVEWDVQEAAPKRPRKRTAAQELLLGDSTATSSLVATALGLSLAPPQAAPYRSKARPEGPVSEHAPAKSGSDPSAAAQSQGRIMPAGDSKAYDGGAEVEFEEL